MSDKHLLKVSRLECLTDGVFAIAMTILAFDLRLPKGIPAEKLSIILTTHVLDKLVVYGISFIILGTLWVAMNFQLGLIARLNRPYLWSHVFYLMFVCVVPFSASLVAEYPKSHAAIIFYVANLFCTTMAQFVITHCAHVFKLNKDINTAPIRRAMIQRLLVAPVFYVLSLILAYWHVRFAFITLLIPTFLYMLPGKVDSYEETVE